MDRPPFDAMKRSIAGNVAPIAAVASRNSKNVPQNATDHCQPAGGSTPVVRVTQPPKGDHTKSKITLHNATTSSHPAYQRTRCALLSMREPSASPPTASPPKNAATTASTAAD